MSKKTYVGVLSGIVSCSLADNLGFDISQISWWLIVIGGGILSLYIYNNCKEEKQTKEI